MQRVGRQCGFSMVEVMVATVIVGLTLAAGVPAFARFTQSARLDGAAKQVAASFRLARQKAVAEGTPYIFMWWNSNWYYLIKDNDRNGVYTSGEPYTGPHWFPNGVTGSNVVGLTSPYLVLSPNGSCNQSGSFTMTNSRGNSLIITLLGPTGSVQISREDEVYEAEIIAN